jgi:hypothetical protein
LSELPQIVPNTALRRVFKPVEGGRLTVTLPGEKLMATVRGIVSRDDVVVELTAQPMMGGKSHAYRKGDFVPCRRGVDDLQVECWRAVSEHELNQAVAAEVLERTRPPEPPQSAEPPAAVSTEVSRETLDLGNWSA